MGSRRRLVIGVTAGLVVATVAACAMVLRCVRPVWVGCVFPDMRPLPAPSSQEYARAVAVCEEYLKAWKKDDYAEEFRLTSVWGPFQSGPPQWRLEIYKGLRARYKTRPGVQRLTWLDPNASTTVAPRPDLLKEPELYWEALMSGMAGVDDQQFEQQWKVWRQGGVAPVVVSFPDGELIMILVQEGGDWRLMTTPEEAWDEDLTMRGF